VLASLSIIFTPGERYPGTLHIGGWTGLRAGLDSNEGLPLSCLSVPLLHGEMALEISVTESAGLGFHCEHVLNR